MGVDDITKLIPTIIATGLVVKTAEATGLIKKKKQKKKKYLSI